MTSEAKNRDRRNTTLAAVIGAVLASYAGSAAALEFELENGTKVNWNTTLSVGASWRASDPSKLLYTKGDGSLIGLGTGPMNPGTAVASGNGTAGNQAAGIADLNYGKGDMFSQPWKLLSDVEVKKGNFGGLLRIKAWYDEALNGNKVRIGNQANGFNGTRPQLGPYPPNCVPTTPAVANCIPLSTPGNNVWPKGKLSDKGFEDEQKFDNLMLLDAYVYGSFGVGNTDLQVRLGNQVVNWGESVFIQGVNQINPIDVPAARRAGAELKEILLPVWMAYANWGLEFGSLEAFYQFKWNNTSVDGCDTYWATTGNIISVNPNSCGSFTTFNTVYGLPVPGTASPLIPQFGSAVYGQATGYYVPQSKGIEPSDSGQFGVAYRFPIAKIDTEIGLYAMNIHNRTPIASLRNGTDPGSLPAAQRAALQAAGLINAAGNAYTLGTSSFPTAIPLLSAVVAQATGGAIQLKPFSGFYEYPEDYQVYGISAATNLLSWSVSAELSYQAGIPVQINGNDLVGSMLAGIGPARDKALAAIAKGQDAIERGYDRYDKTQFQVNTVKTYSNILGSENLAIVAEVGMQSNNVPDYTKGGVRYGRGSMWGTASGPDLAAQQPITAGNTCSPTVVNAPVPLPSPLYNPSPKGCKNDGFVTDFAWGYRLRVSADYNNLFNSGITMTPSVFWSQDVEGVSMDSTFIQDRTTLGLGLKFSYNKKYVLDLNWVDYGNDNYDPLFDRDYYSAAVSVTF